MERSGHRFPSALGLAGRRCCQTQSMAAASIQFSIEGSPILLTWPPQLLLYRGYPDGSRYSEVDSPTPPHRHQQTTRTLPRRFRFKPPSNAWPIRLRNLSQGDPKPQERRRPSTASQCASLVLHFLPLRTSLTREESARGILPMPGAEPPENQPFHHFIPPGQILSDFQRPISSLPFTGS